MDGLHLVIARKLVVAVLRPGLAPILRLRMAVPAAKASRFERATRRPAQVQITFDVCECCRSWYCI